ncbi:MAG: STAS domain-containing protein [Isosphaeraceae bacterium]
MVDEPLPFVSWSGPSTMAEVGRHRERLLEVLAEGRGARIDLEASGPWDLAGLQLLLSALESGRRSGRLVRLSGIPAVLRDLAIRGGHSHRLEAATDPSVDG